MLKYNIEGNIDFFSELYKSLDVEDDNDDDENGICLITKKPLIDKFVELNCGHKFNYIPLYKDIYNHKYLFNKMEGLKSYLKTNEIRCPYCRTKQTGVLPYYEDLGLEKKNGVNYYDEIECIEVDEDSKCSFKYLNDNFDDTKPESVTNQKYIFCKSVCVSKINVYNPVNPSCPITYNDNNLYCFLHKQKMIKKYKEDIKEKLKEEVKKIKEEKQKLREEKQKLREEKQKLRQESVKIIENEENIIIGPLVIENQEQGCVQILKFGKNKGLKCGCKIMMDNLCQRHLSNKNIK